jgi:hypothetical protein
MKNAGEARFDGGVLTARWQAGDKYLALCANFSERAVAKAGLGKAAKVIWGTTGDQLQPWSVLATIGGQ